MQSEGMRTAAVVCLFIALVIALGLGGCASPAVTERPTAGQVPLYRNADAPVAVRVDDLLGRMSREEKIAQVLSLWARKTEILDDDFGFHVGKARERLPHGLGQFARPNDAIGPGSPRELPWRSVEDTVAIVNALQNYAVNETRLGIPVLFHEEGLHGYQAVGATSFPQAIAMASTWDPDLVREINSITAREIRARGAHLALSPVVDVARDPRWGRIEETFGEDPFLVSEMGVAAVQGLQGELVDGKLQDHKVFATLKHMTGHGQPESGTNAGPAQIPERVLREVFFPPFEAAVTRTDVMAVMASYNEIDGVPSHANRWLLQDVLRGEWGFEGTVVSDYNAIEQLADLHHIVPDHAGAAVIALRAGVDVDLPDGVAFATLADALDSGRITMAELDRAVARHLEIKFRAGLFESPYASAEEAQRITNSAEARRLARVAARRSIVLLKNNGVLPLVLGDDKPTIAVIGPNAAVARLGGYYGIPPETVSLLEGMRNRAGSRAYITHAEGVKITESDDWWADEVVLASPADNQRRIDAAIDVARDADTIVLAIGDTEQTSREGWAPNHLGDRSSLELVGEQQDLFDALRALGKPIVVVLINGRPLATTRIAYEADALLEAWYPGEQGGNALADVLFGDYSPGGKLPVTIPRNVGQLPVVYNHKPSARRGYLFETTEPLFPFGYGLSYTRFELGAPRLSAREISPGDTVDVTVSVRNVGPVKGDETVQLYIRDKVSSVTRPVKELRAFERITLAPGEAADVTFSLGPEALRMFDGQMQRVVEPGDFEIMTGPNSVDLSRTTLTVRGPT